MSGGGHLFDMIGRLKVNAALRRGKRAEFRRIKEMYVESFAWRNFHEQKHEAIDEKELQRVKQQVRKEIKASIRKENRKRVVVLFITLVTIVLLLVSFYNI